MGFLSMSNMYESFEVGKLYSNEEIYTSLSVGNAGGVRARTDKLGRVERLVIMTSTPSARQLRENPYHDRLEGDFLIYTGAGRAGNQSVSGPNARIVEQGTHPFPVYGFMLLGSRRNPKLGNRRWSFLGLLEYLRCYGERQIDSNGDWRNAGVFELRVHSNPPSVRRAIDSQIMGEILAKSRDNIQQEREIASTVAPEKKSNCQMLWMTA